MPFIDTTKFTDANSLNIFGVQCWDAGTTESFDRYNSSSTRTLVCRWNQRAQLMNALNPGATDIAGVLSFAAVPYPDFTQFYPQKFNITGEGRVSVGPNGMVAYQYAVVECEYSPFNAGDLSIDVGANVITLPRTGPCLESDESNPVDVPFQDTPGKPIAVINIVKGKNNVPSLPMATIKNCAVNPLNINPFFGYDPGTVLFQGGRARKLTLTNIGTGTVGTNSLLGPFDVEYRFLARPEIPWDTIPFRKKDGTFVLKRIRFKNGQGPFLGRSNFDALLNG